ncbi:Cyanobacterial protein [Synechocystis sp. PCC 6714]|nr:Cyanobacterial protein [Synechocystis sp. PCC 6714]
MLTSLLEQQWEGKYVLTLSFDSPFISLETWQEKQEKIAKFFGPDLEVNISQPQEKVVLINLISQLALP